MSSLKDSSSVTQSDKSFPEIRAMSEVKLGRINVQNIVPVHWVGNNPVFKHEREINSAHYPGDPRYWHGLTEKFTAHLRAIFDPQIVIQYWTWGTKTVLCRGFGWFFQSDFSFTFLAESYISHWNEQFGGSFIKIGPFLTKWRPFTCPTFDANSIIGLYRGRWHHEMVQKYSQPQKLGKLVSCGLKPIFPPFDYDFW